MSQQPSSPEPRAREGHETAEQTISAPIGDQDLTTELAGARRSTGKLTMGLIIAAVVVASFVGGVFTHKAVAGSGSSASPAAGRQGGQGGARGGYGGGYGGGFGAGQGGTGGPGGAQGPGGFGAGRGGTVGTIDHVDGSTVYVKTRTGQVVKVSTSGTTKVRVTGDGALKDLTPGASVVVQGQAGSDGAVTAQTITKQPAAN